MTPTQVLARPAPPTTAKPRRRRRRWALVSLSGLAVVLGGYTWWTHTHAVRLTASVEIKAAPEEVWKVLTDFSAYPQWNPFMTRGEITSGDRLRPGATIRIRLDQPSGTSTMTPEVLSARPGHELRWLGKLGPGWLVDGEHRFLIEKAGPGVVRLTQSESFTGVLVPIAEGKLQDETLPKFRAMNSALKERVESARR
ncbi:SRPBCC domain-containing protein [Streptomyces yaanensis]|uniref:SRPBCC domain-containing protein n=1 Tax=Streptomyces yaanensis TaxID=1142239 RepID=A0ABV7SH14_9ACTN|nr:SRPBCC domain-containing protein [Streptomyces sp. CGMCC 4.7035]WNB99328.1 SRPBCC domain-containing protein [Streptomyces sp. CGMCC 4.7035]